MHFRAKICSDRLRRKQGSRDQKVQSSKSLRPTTARGGTPLVIRVVEVVPVELWLVVIEVDIRHLVGALVAGTRNFTDSHPMPLRAEVY